VARAARHDLTVAIHAIGNRAIAAALDAVVHGRSAVPGSASRIRIDHFFWGTDATVARARALEVGVVTQPVGIWQFGDRAVYQSRPPQFLSWPVAQLRATGVPVGGSSDAPCFALPPIWAVGAMVERRTIEGRMLASEQAVDVIDALSVYTLGAAWAGGSDDVEGSITPGKLANLVVLAQDPRAVATAHIRDIRVDETWLDGKREYTTPVAVQPLSG